VAHGTHTHTVATRVGGSGVTSGAPPTRSGAWGVRGHGASAPPRVGPSDGRHTHGWSREGRARAAARSGARSPQTAIGAAARQAPGQLGGGWPLGHLAGGFCSGRCAADNTAVSGRWGVRERRRLVRRRALIWQSGSKYTTSFCRHALELVRTIDGLHIKYTLNSSLKARSRKHPGLSKRQNRFHTTKD